MKLQSRRTGQLRMGKRGGLREYFRREWLLYAMLLPVIVHHFIFSYLPMAGIAIAFKDYNLFSGIAGSPWVGLDVFRGLFLNNEFYRSIRNTLLLNVLSLLVIFPVPIFLAVMLNEVSMNRLKKSLQTMLYLPHFMSWVIIGGVIYQMFATNTGVVNTVIKALGGSPVPFLTDKFCWVAVYLGSGVWQGMGWNAIIFLAAITGIAPELYEAARVDGAGRFKRIWHITLPSIRSTIAIMFILAVGGIMNIGFDKPFMLGNAMVQDVSEVISTFVYRIGLTNAMFSEATAVGLFQSVINLVMLILANTVTTKLGESGIW